MAKILKNKLDYTFFEAELYYIFTNARTVAKCKFFLRENKTKNLRPNEFTNCYAERENQRISFFVIKTKPQRNMVVSIILSITFL